MSAGARAAILAATGVSSKGSSNRKECSSSMRRQVLLRHCVTVLRVSDQQSTVCHEDPCKPIHIGVTLH